MTKPEFSCCTNGSIVSLTALAKSFHKIILKIKTITFVTDDGAPEAKHFCKPWAGNFTEKVFRPLWFSETEELAIKHSCAGSNNKPLVRSSPFRISSVLWAFCKVI